MIPRFRALLPALLFIPVLSAHAQFYKLHGGTVSVGATGQFTEDLTSGASPLNYNVPFGTAGVSTYPETINNQQQFTTLSAGFLGSFQFHPKPWAGVELNYGFTHYSERYTFNYSTPASTQGVSVPTSAHEATAAYQFHPHHIPFQPFVNIGGGAIDFNPRGAMNQWRGAGLVETGFDIPTRSTHLAFRVQGRSLIYRAPNFDQPAISTRTWRANVQPGISAVYRF
jgi:hypothetical protein